MEPIKQVINAPHTWSITGTWVHNGELIIQAADTGDLVVVGRFAVSDEVVKQRKKRKPRTSKSGLARSVLADNDGSPTSRQGRSALAAAD